MVKVGKGQTIRQRTVILDELRSNLYHAFMSKTLTWKEFQELQEYVRDVTNWETLIGVKQLSIFDTLPDEPFNIEANIEHTKH